MFNSLKKFIPALFHYTGFNQVCGYWLRHDIFLLGYHSVVDPTIEDRFQSALYPDLSISVNHLAEQIAYLQKRGHTITSFKNLASVIASGAPKPTVIFFDDGFRDNLYNAAPLLQQYGITATVFTTTGFIDRTHFALTSYYRYLLQQAQYSEAQIELAILEFKKKSYVDRQKAIDLLHEQFPEAYSWQDFSVFLDWEEVKKLSTLGWEVGSHGVSHTKVTECAENALEDEILKSKEKITAIINESVVAFSYPHGRYHDSAQSALGRAGYTYAVSTKEGVNTRHDLRDHPFALKKIAPRVGETMAQFTTRLYARSLFKKYDHL